MINFILCALRYFKRNLNLNLIYIKILYILNLKYGILILTNLNVSLSLWQENNCKLCYVREQWTLSQWIIFKSSKVPLPPIAIGQVSASLGAWKKIGEMHRLKSDLKNKHVFIYAEFLNSRLIYSILSNSTNRYHNLNIKENFYFLFPLFSNAHLFYRDICLWGNTWSLESKILCLMI